MRNPVADYALPPGATPAQKFEHALIMARQAVDSKGLRVMLPISSKTTTNNDLGITLPCYSSGSIRGALCEFASKLDKHDMVFVNMDSSEDADGKLAYARNLQLIVNVYVAALEYEKSARP